MCTRKAAMLKKTRKNSYKNCLVSTKSSKLPCSSMENDSKALVIGTELDTVKCLKLPSAVMDKAQECSFHDNILKKTV